MHEIKVDDHIQDIIWVEDLIYLIGRHSIWQSNSEMNDIQQIYTVLGYLPDSRIKQVICIKPNVFYIGKDIFEKPNQVVPTYSEVVEFNVDTHKFTSVMKRELWERMEIFERNNGILVAIIVGKTATLLDFQNGKITASASYKGKVDHALWNEAIKSWIIFSGQNIGFIDIWYTRTGEISNFGFIHEFINIEYNLCMRSDGRYCIYHSKGQTYIWDFMTRKIVRKVDYMVGQPFLSDGRVLAWLSNNEIVSLELIFALQKTGYPDKPINEDIVQISARDSETDDLLGQIILPLRPLFQDGIGSSITLFQDGISSSIISPSTKWLIAPQKKRLVVLNLKEFKLAGQIPFNMSNESSLETLKWKDNSTQLADLGTSGDVLIWDTTDANPHEWQVILSCYSSE